MKQTLTLALVATIVTVSAIAVVQYQQDDSLATQEKRYRKHLYGLFRKVQAMPGQLLGKKEKGNKISKGELLREEHSEKHGNDVPAGLGSSTSFATPNSGIVGIPDGRVSDNPEDNLFEITLAKVPSNSRVWLVYDLKGVSSASGVSKSINDRPGVGGYLTALSKEWKTVQEEISPSWVKAGKNTILFTLPSDASYSYSVRNVRIETSPLEKTQESIVFSEHPTAYGSLAYVHGFIRGKADGITISGQKITVRNGEFEACSSC